MQENEMIKMLDLNANRYIYTKHQLFKIFENLPNKCPKTNVPKKCPNKFPKKSIKNQLRQRLIDSSFSVIHPHEFSLPRNAAFWSIKVKLYV